MPRLRGHCSTAMESQGGNDKTGLWGIVCWLRSKGMGQWKGEDSTIFSLSEFGTKNQYTEMQDIG